MTGMAQKKKKNSTLLQNVLQFATFKEKEIPTRIEPMNIPAAETFTSAKKSIMHEKITYKINPL